MLKSITSPPKKEVLEHEVLETIMQNLLKRETTFSVLKCSLLSGVLVRNTGNASQTENYRNIGCGLNMGDLVLTKGFRISNTNPDQG